MHNAFLNVRLRIDGSDRLAEAVQVIHAVDQDILNAAAFQIVQNAKPELGVYCIIEMPNIAA